MVVIRLSRGGRKDRPFYSVCVADNRFPRDGKFIEKVGHYDPLAIKDRSILDKNKIEKWLKDGAQMSDRVKWLYEKSNDAGCLPPKSPKKAKKKEAVKSADDAAAADSSS